MKNKIFLYITILLIPFFQSCEKEGVQEQNFYQAQWFDNINLTFTSTGEGEFEYKINESNGESFWGATEVNYNVGLNMEGSFSDISKIELYIFAEEINGDDYNYLGGPEGKLIKTIENPTDSFELTLTTEMLYNLFINDFSSSHNGEILPDDFFELKWVITGKDGFVVDTRNDCIGFNCSYGIRTNVVYVDTWIGAFQYEWLDVGPDTTYYFGVNVGDTGTINFTKSSDIEGAYVIDDMSFGGTWMDMGGYSIYDESNQTLTLTNTNTYANKWAVESVTPDELIVVWDYIYTTYGYEEYGTLKITRDDGLTWPENLTIINN